MILKNNNLIYSFSNKTKLLKKIYRFYMKTLVTIEKEIPNKKTLIKIEDLNSNSLEKLSKYKINNIGKEVGSNNIVVKLRNINDTDFVVSEPQSNLFAIVKDTEEINNNLDNIINSTIKDKEDIIKDKENKPIKENEYLINDNNNNSDSVVNDNNINTTNTNDTVNNSAEISISTTEVSNTIENNVSVIRSNILKLEDLSQMKESNLKIAEQITEQFKNISFVNQYFFFLKYWFH